MKNFFEKAIEDIKALTDEEFCAAAARMGFEVKMHQEQDYEYFARFCISDAHSALFKVLGASDNYEEVQNDLPAAA